MEETRTAKALEDDEIYFLQKNIHHFAEENSKITVECLSCRNACMNRKRPLDPFISLHKDKEAKKLKTQLLIFKHVPKTRVVRLKRSKQQIIQDCDVYIGRKLTMGGWNLPQSKWANPFTIKDHGSAEIVVEKYRKYLLDRQDLLDSLDELKGKTLGCWCKPGVCHGDVLVELIEQKENKV